MANLELVFRGEEEEAFSPRNVRVQEGISTPFVINAWLRSAQDDAELDRIVGSQAGLKVAVPATALLAAPVLMWSGVCVHMELIHAEPTGLSTYAATIMPDVWLLTQRTNCRIFQRLSGFEIAKRLLEEWHIDHVSTDVQGDYPKLDYRVQYGESDFAFLSRTLEEWGISYYFRENEGRSQMVLTDHPERAEPAGVPLPFIENASNAAGVPHARHVYRATRVVPGMARIRDYDFRNPSFRLLGEADPRPPEDKYEQYSYAPGTSEIVRSGGGGGADGTPTADARGAVRSDQGALKAAAQRRLDAQRAPRKRVSFQTNAVDLQPGRVVTIAGHPRKDLDATTRLLLTGTTFEAGEAESWTLTAHTIFADEPFRPALATPKPKIFGVQSAVVTGPSGEEIHTDEFGRVRVQFHWDREGQNDDQSSCWLRVSQGWAGTGYGVFTVPRVGQEVLVCFLEGDADQPVVVGRLFNGTQRTPYKLPQDKTKSVWKSNSSPGGGGFNEITLEDAKDKELVFIHAQRDLKKIVLRNETHDTRVNRNIHVGHNLSKTVDGDESESTGGNRNIKVTGCFKKCIKGEDLERTNSNRVITVGAGLDMATCDHKIESVAADSHLKIEGDSREQVEGKLSLKVKGDAHIKIGGCLAESAGGDMYLHSGGTIVIEAATQISLKVPGAFIDIGPGGIAISGPLVRLNSGGSPASGSAPSPDEPKKPRTVSADDCWGKKADKKPEGGDGDGSSGSETSDAS